MNSSNAPASDSRYSEGDRIPIAAILSILVLIFSVAGNVLVACAVCFKRQFSRPANFMLANLSINSLLRISSTIFGLLAKNYPLISYGRWTCHVYPVQACTVPAEGFIMMCISFERLRAVRRPLERENGKSAWKKIAGIWIASIIIELPHGFFWEYTEESPSYLKCINTKEVFGSKDPYIVYVWSYFLVSIILPISFMFRESLQLVGRLKFLLTMQADWTEYQLNSYKLIRNALVFIVIFISLKLPGSLVYLVTRMPPGVFPQGISDWASSWKSALFRVGTLNGALYPLVTFALSNKIRELFSCCTDGESPPSRSVHPMWRRP